jgi:hypothetical protein
MFKLIFPVCLCLAAICPNQVNGQDCGGNDYDDLDCYRTRKKIGIVESCIDIKRLRRVCETDECGNSRSRLALVSESVTFKRLGLVDVPVDPCRPNLFERIHDKFSSCSLRNRFGRDQCDECCGETVGDDWGDGIDFASEGHYSEYDNGNHFETFPRESIPRQPIPRELIPRATQPREMIPRSINPRISDDNYYAPQGNSSVIEPSMERNGYER